jgi:hypothetical protein
MDSPATKLLEIAGQVAPQWADRLLQRVIPTGGLNAEELTSVAEQVRTALITDLRQLLEKDPAEQRTNPLTIFRRATAPITALAQRVGVPPVQRDEFEMRSFPDDIYGLYPVTWADIDPRLVEPGLEWGAWKAAVIISRHRST